MKIHEGNHTGEKPFNCIKCGKGFSGSKYLKYHQRVHEEKKPLKCTKCYRSFPRWRFMKGLTLERIQNLFRIKRLEVPFHSGEKQFKCTICDRNFSTSSGGDSQKGLKLKRGKNVTWTSAYQITLFKCTKYPPESVNVNILCAVRK